MNKKLKVVSSIALAGLLALNVCNPKTLATTIQDEIKTSPVGIYKKLVEGKTVVPFVLANAEDCVTYKEIANSDKFVNVTKFNGSSIPNENTLISTGDTFVADGKEYTVVIYGDINKDGFVDVNDALQVKQYYVGNVELDKVQLEAADVRNNEDVDVNDALDMQKFYVGSLTSVIDKLPDMEEVKYDYSLSVNEGIINNQNVSNSKVTVNVAQVSEKDVDLTLNIKGLDIAGKDKTVTKAVKITKNTTKVDVENIDVSALVDGILSVELVAENDEIVGTTTAIKNTVAPTATNVNTKRTSTRTATLSLEGYGANDITKVYYVIGNTIADVKNAKTIEVSNNKVENYEVSNELTEGTSANVTFILENQYGSRSIAETVVIAKDNAEQTTAVKEVKATIVDNVATGEFTWKDDKNASATYKVNILKDNKIVAVTSVTDKKVNISSNAKETGTYKITVQVKGTADAETSDIVVSDEIVVSKLETVKNVKLENKEDGTYLTYENPNKEGTFKEINVQLTSLKADGTENTPEVVTLDNKGKITSPALTANTIYFAKVSVVAKDNQVSLIDSDEAVSNKIYSLTTTAPSLSGQNNLKDTSVEYTVSNPIAITGIKTEYKVEVYDASNADNSDETKAQYTLLNTKNVELSKDNKIVIDGLESNKKYAFKLITTVEGIELKSDYTSTINTKAIMPTISNLTVTKDEKEAKENLGKIFASENKIVISGTVYDNTNSVYPSEFANSVTLVGKFATGDIISINDKTITATLNDKESTRAFGDLTGYTLNVICNNKYAKTITGTFKEINLNGNGSIYDVSGITADSIVLNDGVEVAGTKTYTISSGATVIINKVTVMATEETEVAANGTDLTITANTTSNNLTFKNTSATTVTFKGLANNSSVQAGTINIVANGDFTLASDKVNVTAIINVEAKSGTVDLQEEALNGSKNVNVTKSEEATVTANFFAKTEAPIELTNVELKDYTDEELVDMSDEESAQELKRYLNSFGINNKGAKITVNEGSNEVTITFDGDKSANAQIKNIK